MQPLKTTREPFLDGLRGIIIALLIPFHAAIVYLKGKGYISDTTGGYPILLCFPVFYLYHFFMDLLFLISGFSSFHSRSQRGAKHFFMERSQKLLLIFTGSFLVLCPACAYFTGILHRNFNGNYLLFYPEFFSSQIGVNLGWGHFWFLLYLYVITCLTVPFLHLFLKADSPIPFGVIIIVYLIGHILIETLLRPAFPGNLMLVDDYANIGSYSLSFICGWALASKKEYLTYLSTHTRPFLIIGILGYLCICGVFLYRLFGGANFISQLSVVKAVPGYSPEVILFNGLTGVYAWSWVLFWIGFGKTAINRKSPYLKRLSRSSFTIYIWHMIPITITAFLVYSLKLNAYTKWLIVTGVTFVFLTLLLWLIERTQRLLQRMK